VIDPLNDTLIHSSDDSSMFDTVSARWFINLGLLIWQNSINCCCCNSLILFVPVWLVLRTGTITAKTNPGSASWAV